MVAADAVQIHPAVVTGSPFSVPNPPVGGHRRSCVYVVKAARAVSYSFFFIRLPIAELMCFSSRGCDKDTHYRLLPGGMPTA